MSETEDVTTEITTFEPSSVRELMATLEKDYSVLPDVDTPEGFEENRVGLRKLVTLRNRADDLRKEINRPYREAIKATDDEAKKVIACIVKLEKPKKEAYDRVQKEAERKKEEEAARERVRIDAIEQRVSQIRAMANVKLTLNDISVALAQLESIDMEDGSFDEFDDAARAAYSYAHTTLSEYKDEAVEREAEAEKVREEAARQAAQKKALDKQLAEIEAAKQALADQQHEMEVKKQLEKEAEAAEKSRKDEEEKAALAAAHKKAEEEKKERDERVAAAIHAKKMRDDKARFRRDAQGLMDLHESLGSLKNAIAETNCDTNEAQAVRMAIAQTFQDIQTFIIQSDVVLTLKIDDEEEAA